MGVSFCGPWPAESRTKDSSSGFYPAMPRVPPPGEESVPITAAPPYPRPQPLPAHLPHPLQNNLAGCPRFAKLTWDRISAEMALSSRPVPPPRFVIPTEVEGPAVSPETTIRVPHVSPLRHGIDSTPSESIQPFAGDDYPSHPFDIFDVPYVLRASKCFTMRFPTFRCILRQMMNYD